jgi:hypothetical protein
MHHPVRRSKMTESEDGGIMVDPDILPAGLDREAVELYATLARGERLSVDAADAWHRLSVLGLLEIGSDGPRVRDPGPVHRRIQRKLRRVLLEVEEEADSVRESFEDLITAFSASTGRSCSGETDVSFEEFTGKDSINAAIEEALGSCESHLLTAQPGGGRSAHVLERALAREQRLLERGVRMRTLYQHPARFNGATRFYVERANALGSEIRTLDEFFDRLIIVDETVAFIPASEDRGKATAIRQPALVQFLTGVFDRAWTRAIPFSTATSPETLRRAVVGTRLAVARLVVEGDTDEVCARRVGLSLRNYREHVRQLMGQFGARSRSELGYRIGRSDLLEKPSEPTEGP